jgi:plasmid maintenance system antidote protein VapI
MNQLDKLKGIHPGIYLADLLKKRHIRPGQFALSIGEYPQTLNAIMKGRRAMNTPLSLKIEKSLNLDEGFLMTLQVFHDIRLEKTKKRQLIKPDLSLFRKGLFWDTDPEKIDWIAQKKAIINRIMERGNEQEKNAIEMFYKIASQKIATIE